MVSGRGSKKKGNSEFEDGTRNWGDGGGRLGRDSLGVKAMNSIFSPFHHWLNTTPWAQRVRRRRSNSESGLLANRTKVQITFKGFEGP